MKKFIKKFILIFLLLTIWQVVYFVFQISNPLIPSPWEIILALISLLATSDFYFDILASLGRVLVGFSLAVFFAVPLGLMLGNAPKIGEYFLPLIEFLRPIPPIAWIPVSILIFGLGNNSAYFIIFLGVFFPVFSNTYFGAASLPQIYKNVFASFEFSNIKYFKEVLLKFCLPYIFAGLKIGIGMAWICVIAAEMIGAQSGLGYFIQINRLYLRTDYMIVGMIIIGLIGYVLNLIISGLEKKIIKWQV